MSRMRSCVLLILLALVALAMAKESRRSKYSRHGAGLDPIKPRSSFSASSTPRQHVSRPARNSVAHKLLEAQGEVLFKGRTGRVQKEPIYDTSQFPTARMYVLLFKLHSLQTFSS